MKMAERKRHYVAERRLRAEVARLENEVDVLTDQLAHAVARAYHPSACPIWRGQECACGITEYPPQAATG